MLLTGFLYCRIADQEKHMENLWHLVNPNFKEQIRIKVLMETIDDLLYVSINQRLSMLQERAETEDEQVEELNGAIDFLESCNDKKG